MLPTAQVLEVDWICGTRKSPLLRPCWTDRGEVMRRNLLEKWLAIALLPALAPAPMVAQETRIDQQAAQEQSPASQGTAHSTLEIKPGLPIIKTKDLAQNAKIRPWERLPRYILRDQRAIWTSPFHTSKADAKWWAIFGGTTAVLLASDKWTSKQLPNTSSQIAVATWTSRLGAVYSLLPISGTFYFIGLGAHDERFRETGILGFEALVNAEILVDVMKMATRRERPLEGTGQGAFWSEKASFWSASFPSGHAITSWALASVVAHEYPHPLIVPITAYSLATTVVVSRSAAREHFASDTVAGAAIGWFIGDYIYAKRHNGALDKPVSSLEHVIAHVHFGGPAQPARLVHPEAERSAALRADIRGTAN